MSAPPHWRPSASLAVLRQRASALAAARGFFAARGVMETETPFIVPRPVSEPQLTNIRCALGVRPGVPYYLHTSPEYHMKRMLAAGAPDIYQICKAWRDGELGARHLPEFTMIEWYRRGLTFDAFIAEACDLVATVAASVGRRTSPPRRLGYAEVFLEKAGFDPVVTEVETIRRAAIRLLPDRISSDLSRSLAQRRDAWLDLIMVEVVEPALRDEGLLVIDRFPAQQAALARLDSGDPRLAERFEIYLDGLELANGFHELADATEQRQRFEADRVRRRELGLPDALPDVALLAALEAGLPDCCGAALGFDRLLMACLGLGRISDVVSFRVPEDD
jgi:lysyl-tRNA synthetase class 2